MADQTVRLERDGGVATLVLDNPPLNLFGPETFPSVVAGVREVAASDARCLVWRAEGRVFSGGVDVHLFQEIAEGRAAGGGPGEVGRGLWEELVSGVRELEALEIPTVAVIHGLCLTAAFEVALGCDVILASESARFGLVERVVGLSPGAGGTQRLAERAGPGRARELVMTGGLYDAETLHSWGVVNRVLPDDEVLDRGMDFARDLAEGPTRAHAATKAVVRAYLERGIEGADREMPGIVAGLFETEDLRRAVASFLEEGPGKATFEGR